MTKTIGSDFERVNQKYQELWRRDLSAEQRWERLGVWLDMVADYEHKTLRQSNETS